MSIDRVDQQKWGCQQACVIADKSKVAAMTLGICCELMRSHGIAKAKGWAYNKQESNHCRFEEKQLGSLQVISLSLSPPSDRSLYEEFVGFRNSEPTTNSWLILQRL